MEYITMNGLNRDVSRIGLGTWSIGGFMWALLKPLTMFLVRSTDSRDNFARHGSGV